MSTSSALTDTNIHPPATGPYTTDFHSAPELSVSSLPCMLKPNWRYIAHALIISISKHTGKKTKVLLTMCVKIKCFVLSVCRMEKLFFLKDNFSGYKQPEKRKGCFPATNLR